MMNQNENLIPVVKGPELKKNGVPTIAGYIPILQLKERTIVDHYDNDAAPGNKKYQRLPNKKRVRDISDGLKEKRFDVPTAITCNIRKGEWNESFLEEHDGSLFLNLDKMRQEGVHFHIVDGSHRSEGYTRMLGTFQEDAIGEESFELEDWKDFKIPFISTLDLDEKSEMLIFYEINSNAKSVPTNLAYTLISEVRKQDPDYAMELASAGDTWKADGAEIANMLGEDPRSVWYQRIRMPNTEEKGTTTVQSSGFANSLKKLLKSSYFGQLEQEDQRDLIDAYWAGLKMCMPNTLGREGFQKNVMTKSVGVAVMHEVFEFALEVLRSRGLPLRSPESYRDLMEKALENLQGEDQNGDDVSGEDFWKSGKKGAAGQYTSEAAKRTLKARIVEEMKSAGHTLRVE